MKTGLAAFSPARARMARQIADLAFVGLFAGIALWAWVAVVSPRREVNVDTWRAVRERIAADHAPADAIVVRPAWLTDAAPALLPFTVDLYGPVDDDFLAHVGRVFAVTTDPSALPAALARRPIEKEERIAGITLRRYATGSPRVVMSFREALASARVALHATTATATATDPNPGTPCSLYAFENWWCVAQPNLDDWRGVGPRRIVVGGLQGRWIWAHPHEGKVLRIGFPSAALGTKLRVTGAFSDAAVTLGAVAVEMKVRIDGEPDKSLTFENRVGATAFDIPTTPGTRAVTFDVAAANVRQRHFVFDAIAVDERAR